MDWQFDTASDGNVALTGEVDAGKTRDFVLGVAFGTTEHDAISTLMQSLSHPFGNHLAAYKKQWQTASAGMADLASHSCDEGGLYRSSCSLLLAH
jgi:glucoamylase